MFRVVANSPAALTGYLQLSAASAQGGLGTATLERIALAVAEINGCDYCLAAHSFLGRKVAKLDDAELTADLKRNQMTLRPTQPCVLLPP